MAELKIPFGLDGAAMSKINWNLALARVSHDLRSDFIYAPHIGFIYAKAGAELIQEVQGALASGKYSPGLPVTIEVSKSFRIRVAVKPDRLGPSFSRPGSILLPYDRLLYQALADQAASIVGRKTDHSRSFSHQLAVPGSASMFVPTRTCWNALQTALLEHSKAEARASHVASSQAEFPRLFSVGRHVQRRSASFADSAINAPPPSVQLKS